MAPARRRPPRASAQQGIANFLRIKAGLADRLREIRRDLYGEDGLENPRPRLGVPAQTWRNYVTGHNHTRRGAVEFVALTETDPQWLLTGEGERLSEEIHLFPSQTVW